MARLDPPDPSGYSDQQKRIADSISSSRGSIRGPFGVWLHAPGLADPAQAVGAYIRFASRLPGNLRELAICTIARRWRADFEWFAHAPLAVAEGIPAEAVEKLRVGEAPAPLAAEEALVHRLAEEIARTGRLGDESYAAGISRLGAEGMVDLVGLCGYYTLVSFTLNVFDVPVPEGAPPFAGG